MGLGPRVGANADEITDYEINNNLYNYAYTSVMDYAGRTRSMGRAWVATTKRRFSGATATWSRSMMTTATSSRAPCSIGGKTKAT